MSKRLFFAGVGGASMSALAELALRSGAEVCGFDECDSLRVQRLVGLGAKIFLGDAKTSDSCIDAIKCSHEVVFSSAFKSDDGVLVAAHALGVKTVERKDFLGEVSGLFTRVVAVAGTHGKTTVTAMIAKILDECKVTFIAHIGESVTVEDGESGLKYSPSFDFGALGRGERIDAVFLTEACEYKRSLLSLSPTLALVLNVDADHPDCYNGVEEVKSVFERFLEKADYAIVPNELENVCHVRHTLVRANAQMEISAYVNGRQKVFSYSPLDIFKGEQSGLYRAAYALYEDGQRLFEVKQRASGAYNASNGVFALACADALGLNLIRAKRALAGFDGVKRRFECVGYVDGVPVIFDYAHNPKQVAAVLDFARRYGRVLAVFQPHTYSRTAAYLGDFATALSVADEVLVLPVYGARETETDGVNSGALADLIEQTYADLPCRLVDADTAVDAVKSNARDFEIVLFLGAGDVYALSDSFKD